MMMKTLSRKLEMEGDNISKIPEKAATISHENQYPTDSILSRLVTKQTKPFYDVGLGGGSAVTSDVTTGGSHSSLSSHQEKSQAGLPGPGRHMINGV